MKKSPFLPVVCTLVALGFWVLLGAGCHGSSEQRDLMFDDLTAGERPVAMKGDATFLDGALTATATVSRGFDRGVKGDGRDGKAGRGKGGEMKNKGREDPYDMGGFASSSYGDSEEAQKEAMEDYMRLVRAQRAAGSPMPPVTLRIRFENHGPAPVTVEVTDVNSDLGNFAVRPDKLTIAAGESGTLDPMISQLGVSSDDIPIKVTLRVAGKKETQVVAVKSLLSAAPKK